MDHPMYNHQHQHQQQQMQLHQHHQQRLAMLAAQCNHNHRDNATTATAASGKHPATVSSAPISSAVSGVCANPIMPIDLGIDLASVKAEIESCKRRYHRDLWSVLCGKVLRSDQHGGKGGAGGADNGWKRTDRDEESGGGGAGVAKRADHHDTARTDEEASVEDDQTGHNGDEDETTDEGANENNRQQPVRQTPLNRQQQNQQQRGGMRRGNAFRDDWNNWNNSADWRTVPAVGFSDRDELPTRQQPSIQPPRRSRPPPGNFETSTAPVRGRREDDRNSTAGGLDFCSASATVARASEGDWEGDNEDFDEDANSADSNGSGPRRKFVPIFCGNWGAVQQQRRQQSPQSQRTPSQQRRTPAITRRGR